MQMSSSNCGSAINPYLRFPSVPEFFSVLTLFLLQVVRLQLPHLNGQLGALTLLLILAVISAVAAR